MSPFGIPRLLQLFEIEARLSGSLDDNALARDDLVSSRSHAFRHIERYNHCAVAVGMNEIAVSGAHPRDVDRTSKVDDMDERMRGNHTTGQHLKPCCYLRDIAYGSVGHEADATHAGVYRAVDLTPQRTIAALFVDVLDDDDARLGSVIDVRVVGVRQLAGLLTRKIGRVGAPNRSGSRHANQRLQLRADTEEWFCRVAVTSTLRNEQLEPRCTPSEYQSPAILRGGAESVQTCRSHGSRGAPVERPCNMCRQKTSTTSLDQPTGIVGPIRDPAATSLLARLPTEDPSLPPSATSSFPASPRSNLDAETAPADGRAVRFPLHSLRYGQERAGSLRPNLVIGRHVCGIVGMERVESERLLDRLADAASQPRRAGGRSGHPSRTFGSRATKILPRNPSK